MIAVLEVTTTILAVAGVLVAAWLGWVAVGRLRTNLLKGPQHEGSAWTLDDLRDMKQSGQITEQEYQVLRGRVFDGSKGGRREPQPNPRANPNDNTVG